jgi:peroxiredoxin
MLEAGGQTPGFTLKDSSGAQHSLESILASGPALLALYKVSCPVCQLIAPYLERLSKGSLQVVTISQDDEAATRKFQQSYGLTAPSLLDLAANRYQLSNALGIDHVPSLFLVEPDRAISYAGSGFRKADLERLATRAGVKIFGQGDNVPEWKAG